MTNHCGMVTFVVGAGNAMEGRERPAPRSHLRPAVLRFFQDRSNQRANPVYQMVPVGVQNNSDDQRMEQTDQVLQKTENSTRRGRSRHRFFTREATYHTIQTFSFAKTPFVRNTETLCEQIRSTNWSPQGSRTAPATKNWNKRIRVCKKRELGKILRSFPRNMRSSIPA